MATDLITKVLVRAANGTAPSAEELDAISDKLGERPESAGVRWAFRDATEKAAVAALSLHRVGRHDEARDFASQAISDLNGYLPVVTLASSTEWRGTIN